MIKLINNLNEILEGAKNPQAIKQAKELEQKHMNNEIAITGEMREVFELLALIEAEETDKDKIVKAVKQAIPQKKEAFDKYIERQNYFTSETLLHTVEAEFYDKGIYLRFEGTRNNLNVFVDNAGKVIRKPVKANLIKKVYENNLGIRV